jgi:hypothetical protein
MSIVLNLKYFKTQGDKNFIQLNFAYYFLMNFEYFIV